MKSLLARDDLRGQVQMVYFDPPYGMGYRSNFQTSTTDQSPNNDASSVPSGDAIPIRAFVDTYKTGIHSYLDSIHKQCALARDLLTESGSIFVQIGDENVHALVSSWMKCSERPTE